MDKQNEFNELSDFLNQSNKHLQITRTQEYKDFHSFITAYHKLKRQHGGYERIATIAGTKSGKDKQNYLLDVFKKYNELLNSFSKERYEKMTSYVSNNNIGKSINDRGDVYDLSVIDEYWNCYDSLKELLQTTDVKTQNKTSARKIKFKYTPEMMSDLQVLLKNNIITSIQKNKPDFKKGILAVAVFDLWNKENAINDYDLNSYNLLISQNVLTNGKVKGNKYFARMRNELRDKPKHYSEIKKIIPRLKNL